MAHVVLKDLTLNHNPYNHSLNPKALDPKPGQESTTGHDLS